MSWFEDWFNSKYYNILYSNRNYTEAAFLIDNILHQLNPDKNSLFLDLGCGKGRHSIYLNKKGFSVHGIDISKTYLSEAKKYENPNLKFELLDMRCLNSINQYNFVINLFTSFGYFENDEDNKKVFNNVYHALKKEGIFIIDFLNPQKVISTIKPFERIQKNDIIFDIKKRHDKQFVYKKISITDKNRKYIFREKVRLINRRNFTNYLKGLNMNLISTFGDYNLNPYTNTNSDRLILVFQKTKS